VSVWRTWVFPIVRLVVFAVIAVALVKVAFFADPPADASDPAVPTGQVTEPTVAVERGTIRNDVVLDGTVAADAAVPIRATLAGEVREVFARQGDTVAADARIASIRALADTPNPDGTPRYTWKTVTAGAAGVLSAMPTLVGQQVAVGDALGQVAPPSFSVTATLPPEQQYRLLNRPADAQVTITGGPAPFTCTGVSITTPLAGASSDDTADGGSGTSTTLRCAVPGDVTVFSGLAAKVTLAAGVAEDVLTLPTTAVEGAAGNGTVYVADPSGGDPVATPVTLGLTDGGLVEITGGVDEGAEVLQFVPGAEPTDGSECGPNGCGG